MTVMSEKELLRQAAIAALLMEGNMRSARIGEPLQALAGTGRDQPRAAVEDLTKTMIDVELLAKDGSPRLETLDRLDEDRLERVARASLTVVEELSEPDAIQAVKAAGKAGTLEWVQRTEDALAALSYSTPRSAELTAAVRQPTIEANAQAAALDRQVQVMRAERHAEELDGVAKASLDFLQAAHAADLRGVLAAAGDQARLESIEVLRGTLRTAGYQVPETGTLRPTPYADQRGTGTPEQKLAIREAAARMGFVLADQTGKLAPVEIGDGSLRSQLGSARLGVAFDGVLTAIADYDRAANERPLEAEERLVRSLTPLVAGLEVADRIDRAANIDTQDPYSLAYPFKLTRVLRNTLDQMRKAGTMDLLAEAGEVADTGKTDAHPAAKELAKLGSDALGDISQMIEIMSDFASAGTRREDEAIVNWRLAKEIGLEDDSKTVVPEAEMERMQRLNETLVGIGAYETLANMAGRQAKQLASVPTDSLDSLYAGHTEVDMSDQAAWQLVTAGTLESRFDADAADKAPNTVFVRNPVGKGGIRMPLEVTLSEFAKLPPEMRRAANAFVAKPGEGYFEGYDASFASMLDQRQQVLASNRMVAFLTTKLRQEREEPKAPMVLKGKDASINDLVRKVEADDAARQAAMPTMADLVKKFSGEPVEAKAETAKTEAPKAEPEKAETRMRRVKPLREALTNLSGRIVVAPSLAEARAIRKVAERVHDEIKAQKQAEVERMVESKERVIVKVPVAELRQFVRESLNSPSTAPAVAVVHPGGRVFLEHAEGYANRVEARSPKTGSLTALKPGSKLHPMLDIPVLADAVRNAPEKDGVLELHIVNQRVVQMKAAERQKMKADARD
jgi:hypothetical protein